MLPIHVQLHVLLMLLEDVLHVRFLLAHELLLLLLLLLHEPLLLLRHRRRSLRQTEHVVDLLLSLQGFQVLVALQLELMHLRL